MKKIIFVYVTSRDKTEAEDIGRTLLKKRLVACINIVDHMHSMYLWPPGKGIIEEANESILICKTLESKWKAVEKEILKLHSYSNPEIAAIPITHLTKKYLDWLTEELK